MELDRETLDGLSVGSVVLDGSDDVAQKAAYGSWDYAGFHGRFTADDLVRHAPLRLLWTPDE